MENTEEIISSEDKTLSMLCHLSMIIGGIIMPIIIWAIKKDKSRFVRFHSLQSIFFHLAFAVILAVIIVIIAAIIIALGLSLNVSKSYNNSHSGFPAFIIIAYIIVLGLIFLISMGSIAYSIYLAVKSYQGEKIRIPVLGKIIYEKVYGKE